MAALSGLQPFGTADGKGDARGTAAESAHYGPD
jgi:hypothetical protein